MDLVLRIFIILLGLQQIGCSAAINEDDILLGVNGRGGRGRGRGSSGSRSNGETELKWLTELTEPTGSTESREMTLETRTTTGFDPARSRQCARRCVQCADSVCGLCDWLNNKWNHMSKNKRAWIKASVAFPSILLLMYGGYLMTYRRIQVSSATKPNYQLPANCP